MIDYRTSWSQIVKDNISRILNLLKIDPSDYTIEDRGILIPIKEDSDALSKIRSIISEVDLGLSWDSRFEFVIDGGSFVRSILINVASIEPVRFSEVFTLDDEELSLLIKLS